MSDLAQKHCVPCEGETTPLTSIKSNEHLLELDKWEIQDDKALEKTLLFKDFKEALAFVNKVGAIAEAEGHHPDISIFGWNKVKVRLTTHAIGGLSDNDFILAAKIDEIVL
jgi:4a-hydroxytetrahydrobiopterin dehydratase